MFVKGDVEVGELPDRGVRGEGLGVGEVDWMGGRGAEEVRV